MDGSLKKLLSPRLADEEKDIPNFAGKKPQVPRTGFIFNEDSITNLAVGANIISFRSNLFVSIRVRNGLSSTEFCLPKSYPDGVKPHSIQEYKQVIWHYWLSRLWI